MAADRRKRWSVAFLGRLWAARDFAEGPIDRLAGLLLGARHQVGVCTESEPWIGVTQVLGERLDADAGGVNGCSRRAPPRESSPPRSSPWPVPIRWSRWRRSCCSTSTPRTRTPSPGLPGCWSRGCSSARSECGRYGWTGTASCCASSTCRPVGRRDAATPYQERLELLVRLEHGWPRHLVHRTHGSHTPTLTEHGQDPDEPAVDDEGPGVTSTVTASNSDCHARPSCAESPRHHEDAWQ